MKVAQIWRYPVKSMAGEQIDHARIGPLGIEGDRVVHVENEDGHIITARTHHRLLGHHATLNESGEPVVDGLPWSDPRSARMLWISWARVPGSYEMIPAIALMCCRCW
ncbi:MAG: hypothetical protein HC938_14665 [Nitrospira sp.]|nr:hypothetical protein [Nitrospira sp.]